MDNLLILRQFRQRALAARRAQRASQEAPIRSIHTLSCRAFSPEGGKGGGSAVQTCQNLILQNAYGDIELKYTYFALNPYLQDWRASLSDLWGGAEFAIAHTQHETDAAYITHDYGTGLGLALLGKRFVYVSHLQGPRVEEKLNYREDISKPDARIIQCCERYVFRKALYVCFPSQGACDYYFASPYRSLDRARAHIGPVLYNTLYAHPEPVPVPDAPPEADSLTFISVGALTSAKGIDRLPSFFEAYLKLHRNKKVRWIVVGRGYLKEALQNRIDALMQQYSHFSVILKEACSYPESRYLMQIADVYLMFHRISIFDLATLEAMREGKCIVLSKTGGNPEFDRDDNIILHDGDDAATARALARADLDMLKRKNIDVYHRYFSNDVFKRAYHGVIDDLLKTPAH
jgi:glycosyltransferase involved in cell wall biosynthesis